MTNNMEEKRERLRLLCNMHFSDVTITYKQKAVIAKPINYNQQGICIFMPDPLPGFQTGYIQFDYQTDSDLITIDQLACEVVYDNQTEVGTQYGIRFNIQKADQFMIKKLADIEQFLEQSSNKSDRYGLFS